jgi:hypothetical protein
MMTTQGLGLALIALMLIATAARLWWHGMRWNGDIWIKGRAAKIAAIVILAVVVFCIWTTTR